MPIKHPRDAEPFGHFPDLMKGHKIPEKILAFFQASELQNRLKYGFAVLILPAVQAVIIYGIFHIYQHVNTLVWDCQACNLC